MSASYSTMRVVAFSALVAVYYFQVQRRGWFVREIKRNDEHDPPADRQGKWDLRHMREDMYMLTITVSFLAHLAIAYVVFHW
jgi:hypothetical protein